MRLRPSIVGIQIISFDAVSGQQSHTWLCCPPPSDQLGYFPLQSSRQQNICFLACIFDLYCGCMDRSTWFALLGVAIGAILFGDLAGSPEVIPCCCGNLQRGSNRYMATKRKERITASTPHQAKSFEGPAVCSWTDRSMNPASNYTTGQGAALKYTTGNNLGR